MALATQLAPFLAPLDANVLGASEVVASFDACWRGSRTGDENVEAEVERVRARFAAQKQEVLALDAKQALLERLAKVEKDGKIQINSEESELKLLEQHEQRLVAELASLEGNYLSLLDDIQQRSARIADTIRLYEDKRKELSDLLNQLGGTQTQQQSCGGGADKPGVERVKEGESDLEKGKEEIQRLHACEQRLKASLESLEQERTRLQEQISVLSSARVEALGMVGEQEAHSGAADAELALVNEKLEKLSNLSEIVQDLSGVAVSQVQGSSFNVSVASGELHLRLHFDPKTFTLSNAVVLNTVSSKYSRDTLLWKIAENLESARKPFDQAVIQHAVETNNSSMLIREMHERTLNLRSTIEELQTIENTHPLSVTTDSREINVALPLSVVATFDLGFDYPKDGFPPRLVSLQAFNGWTDRLMNETRVYIDDLQSSKPREYNRLTKLIDAIQQRFETLKQEQLSAS